MVIVHIIARKTGKRKVIGGADFPKTGVFFDTRRQNGEKGVLGAAVITDLRQTGREEVSHNAGKELPKQSVDNVNAKI